MCGPGYSQGDDVTYLIQANMDHWDSDPAHDTQDSLVRCKCAAELLRPAIARGCVTEADLWALLWTQPIYEKGITLYCTVMNPAAGTFRSLSEPPEGCSASSKRCGSADVLKRPKTKVPTK